VKGSAPLKYLFPGWFASVMGLGGLALAWHRAAPVMGEAAAWVAAALAALAAGVFGLLAAAAALRWQRHPEAWAEDLRHPVRHTFVAALPISLLLLATAATALGLHQGAAGLVVLWCWRIGALWQLATTVWVLGRWWRGASAGGLTWAGVTPALFIPIVGNVLVPLAGLPLGQADWSAAQFGVGLLFWPVVLVLLATRLVVQGPWPERLRPTAFIVVAPPAVVGLALLQWQAPMPWVWMCWGMAGFSALWAGTLFKGIAAMPFGMPHWGLSFPLAALTALTLRLATPGPMQALAVALLALVSWLVAWLALATLRGLRDGSLLAPEPVAMLAPTAP
jgi:tellurite resistance protein